MVLMAMVATRLFTDGFRYVLCSLASRYVCWLPNVSLPTAPKSELEWEWEWECVLDLCWLPRGYLFIYLFYTCSCLFCCTFASFAIIIVVIFFYIFILFFLLTFDFVIVPLYARMAV